MKNVTSLMPNFLPHTCRSLALLLCVAFAGCALEKYSFETFGRPKRAEAYANNTRSDQLALIYADYVALLLEGRSTGARVTRDISDSTLAVGSAFLAATETLEISAETVAGIGVGAVIIRELQKIFNAGGRSEAFADAAYLIRQAQSEYRQYNPNPSPDRLTENGAILVSRVDAAVHAARKSMNGRMPGLLDLKQATQPMTPDGADRESSGTPRTMFTASGELPVLRGPETAKSGQKPPPVVKKTALQLQKEIITLAGKLPDGPLAGEIVSAMDALDPSEQVDPTDPTKRIVRTLDYARTRAGLKSLTAETFSVEQLQVLKKAVEAGVPAAVQP